MSSPAGDRQAVRNVRGVSIIPNGRLLRPMGRQIVVPPHPFGLTLSPDGTMLAAISCGREPVAVTLMTDLEADVPYVRQFPPGATTDPEDLRAAFMGIAFAPDRRTLYVSGGDEGTVVVFDLVSGSKRGLIDLNGEIGGTNFIDSYVGEMALTRDGRRLYAVDQANFRLVMIDTQAEAAEEGGIPGAVAGSVEVGRYPFAVELSPDEKNAYVANIGMFEYSLIRGIDRSKPETWLAFPPFAFDSPEARDGTTIGDLEVPGLGDPNAPESFSVWRVDISTQGSEKVTGKVKTGVQVGEMVEDVPAVGGSSPNSIAADDKWIYVSNGSNDTVSVIDAEKFEVVDTIDLALKDVFGSLKGQIPFGLTLSPDGKRLYVCEAGINAIAAVDTEARSVLGHYPTAWFPSKVAISPDGKKLYVSCAKGFGAGPNGGRDFISPPGGASLGNLMKGVVEIIEIQAEGRLPAITQRVIDNIVKIEEVAAAELEEPRNPIPPYSKAYESPIKHVVYITKENRTYDQIFGEYEKGDGDATLADFGLSATVRGRGQPTIEGVNVMPNHQALAREFAMSDNFYCDSDHSNDGHRWLVGTFPNTWVETATKVARRSGRMASSAPGRRLMTGSSGVIYPEDYNEAGSIWEHLYRNGIEFYNFGLGFEYANHDQSNYPNTGIRLAVNYPMPAPLFERTSRTFATYNTSVPDQIRVNHFDKEFEERWVSGNEPFPPLITMMLPNDHGAGANAERGYPYGHSYMADNDLALARVIETLSHSKWWREMAIIVTEDDAQGGQDHVDHHRSILMVISPYAKRGHVTHAHTSFGSILKTIFLVLGAPSLNQYDAAASDLADCFTDEPDFTPYIAIPIDERIFDPVLAVETFDEKLAWEPGNRGPALDAPEFTREQRQELQERRLEERP